MSRKTLIWIGLFIGSTIGGFIPSVWGSGLFSFSGLLGNAIGGILGIWAGFKLGRYI